MSPILVIPPQLTQAPQVVGDRLQMVGLVPTRPQAVQFALAFQQVEGGWMIDEISLRVAPLDLPPPTAVPPSSDLRTAERGPRPALSGSRPR